MQRFDSVLKEIKEKRELALQWTYKNKFQDVLKELKEYNLKKIEQNRLKKEKEEYERTWYGYFISFFY